MQTHIHIEKGELMTLFNFQELTAKELLAGLEFLVDKAKLSADKIVFNPNNKQWSALSVRKNFQGLTELENFLSAVQFFLDRDVTATTEEEKRLKSTIRIYYELFLI